MNRDIVREFAGGIAVWLIIGAFMLLLAAGGS